MKKKITPWYITYAELRIKVIIRQLKRAAPIYASSKGISGQFWTKEFSFKGHSFKLTFIPGNLLLPYTCKMDGKEIGHYEEIEQCLKF